MIHKTLFVSAFVSLALALTACPGSTPAPTVSSVVVTAPASNALKINAPTAFTATAKDSSGAEITGKTFTWVSSDPNVASVDASGMVTAKRFGNVKITASTDGVNGESSSQTTFGLEVVGGVSSGVSNSFLVRFHNADGSSAKTNVNMIMTGPSGWNGNQPYQRNNFYLGDWWWFNSSWFGPAVTPVSGAYSATATINSQTYTSSFTLAATQTLPAITGLVVNSASASSVTGSWNAVSGALSYEAEVWNDTDKRSEGITMYVTGTSATVTGLSLSAVKSYFFHLFAFGTNVTLPLTVPITTQHDVAFQQVAITF